VPTILFTNLPITNIQAAKSVACLFIAGLTTKRGMPLNISHVTIEAGMLWDIRRSTENVKT